MRFKSIWRRTINTFKDIDSRPNLVFLHVPKCGGTSIDTAIRSQYFTLNKSKDNLVYDRADSLRSAYIGSVKHNLNFEKGDTKNNRNMEFNLDFIAYRMLDPNIKYVSGHFPFDLSIYNEFSEKFDFFTILRDPVEKWLSNYYYRGNRFSLVKGQKLKHWDINEDIDTYLNSERGHYHGYDYAKYYGGLRSNYNYNTSESIASAKDNLKKFKIIGFLDELDKFKYEFEDNYNFSLDISHRKQSRDKEIELPADTLEKIKQVCKADIEIYTYAKSLAKSE